MRRRCPDDRRRRHHRSSGLHSTRGAGDQPGRHRPGRSGNHGSHPHTDQYSDRNTNSDINAYPDPNSNTDADTHSHPNAHSDGDADTHSHPDAHSNTHVYPDAYPNADDYPDAHQHADARPYPDADAHPHQYSDSDAYPDAYSNARPRSDRRRSRSDRHSPRLRGRPSIYHRRKHPTRTPTTVQRTTPTRTPTVARPATPSANLSIPDLVERVRAGVVLVLANSGSGSGFIVDSQGHILTNEHVIDGSSRVTVVLDNGSRLPAQVVSSDAARDIALLKVTTSARLTVLPLAAQVRAGEEVVALGYPLSLGSDITVTRGIVSALRTIRGVDYAQTDAAINPGNSGGPLLNLRGEVVGMNTFVRREIFGEDYFAQGIGFAIKSNVLSSRLQVMKSGSQPFISTPTRTPVWIPPSGGDSYGPVTGTMEHDPDDGFIPTFNSRVDFTDSVVEATFRNPPLNTWSYGIMSRNSAVNTFHAVVIHSAGSWHHYLRTGSASTDSLLQSSGSANIRTDTNGENRIRVIAQGDRGWLFINGEYEAELDLSGLTDSGSIKLLGAYFTGHERRNTATRFYGFTIRPITKSYGPTHGDIEYDPDYIDEWESYTTITDGIIEARFSNPYHPGSGSWSSGFLFRSSNQGEFHVAAVTSDGYWFHYLRSGDVDSTQRLAYRPSSSISTSASGSNHIRIIVVGSDGWLFVNGHYVERLQLGGWLEPGTVSAIASYFTGDGIAGRSTSFQLFTIWSIAAAP